APECRPPFASLAEAARREEPWAVRAGLLFLPLLLSAAPASPPLVQVEVKDVVPLKELNQHAVVLVSKEDGTVLPLFVDETAAVAIAFRLMGLSSPHPLALILPSPFFPPPGARRSA